MSVILNGCETTTVGTIFVHEFALKSIRKFLIPLRTINITLEVENHTGSHGSKPYAYLTSKLDGARACGGGWCNDEHFRGWIRDVSEIPSEALDDLLTRQLSDYRTAIKKIWNMGMEDLVVTISGDYSGQGLKHIFSVQYIPNVKIKIPVT